MVLLYPPSRVGGRQICFHVTDCCTRESSKRSHSRTGEMSCASAWFGMISWRSLNAKRYEYQSYRKRRVHNGRAVRHCLDPFSIPRTDGNSPRFVAAKKNSSSAWRKHHSLADTGRSPTPSPIRSLPTPTQRFRNLPPFTACAAARRRAAVTNTPQGKAQPPRRHPRGTWAAPRLPRDSRGGEQGRPGGGAVRPHRHWQQHRPPRERQEHRA